MFNSYCSVAETYIGCNIVFANNMICNWVTYILGGSKTIARS